MMHTPALEASRGMAATPKNIQAITKGFGEESARWAFTQWELRRRASAKFDRAEEMLFDREGLEMATHEEVAAFHASLFPSDVPVLDLTVGLGADLIALARRGAAEGFEIDPDRAELARHNLAVHGLSGSVSSQEHPHSVEGYFFADPARRGGGQRKSLRPEDYEPSLSVLALMARDAKGAVLKLSPLLADRYLDELEAQIVFVSHNRECKEALALFGECRRGERGAVHVESGEWLESGQERPFGIDTPGQFFYEADPAAIRANALESFGMDELGDSNGYLTSDSEVQSPWLRGYRVLYSGKADVKLTKAKLEELGSATPIVKQRQAGIEPETVRKQLKLTGKRPLILAVWPVGKSLRHTILELSL